jgi:hypothetical protein
MGLSFTFAAGSRQHSHFQVRVLRDSSPHFTVSHSRLPQRGEPGPRIYIPQEQCGPVIPPSTGFPFLHLLWLAGLRWRYSIPPPPEFWSSCCISGWPALCNLGAERIGITVFYSSVIVSYQSVSTETWLLSRCVIADWRLAYRRPTSLYVVTNGARTDGRWSFRGPR